MKICKTSYLTTGRPYILFKYLTMFLERCSDDQRKKIYEEINITEESLKQDVRYLIEWLEKQPHLPAVKG